MKKIIDINYLNILRKNYNKEKKKIVLCHGVFDLIHIGHMKHFKSAKNYGDILVVSITPDNFVNKGPKRPVFGEKLRAELLSNISSIDYVVINNTSTAINLIKKLKPNIYCKGPDYKKHSDDITGQIKNEIKALKSHGGKIKYTSDITNSSSTLINEYYSDLSSSKKKAINKIKKANFNTEKIFNSFKKLKALVIGETIIDQYFFCETLGKSGKDPILQMHELNSETYIGGAAAIAGNLAKFCKSVSFISMIGEDKKFYQLIKKKLANNIDPKFFFKKNSPTIIKKKYIDIVSNHKVFGSYIINDSPMDTKNENELHNYLKKKINHYDLIVVSDYGHGFISKKNAKIICNKSKFLALNAQINAANRGYHTMDKYIKSNCIIINETELRHELRNKNEELKNLMKQLTNKIKIKDLIVTKGSQGATLYSNQSKEFYEMDAFAEKVVDKIGSGDTMLSIIALCLKLKLNKYLSLLISSLAASQSVGSIGNKYLIDEIKLKKAVEHTLK